MILAQSQKFFVSEPFTSPRIRFTPFADAQWQLGLQNGALIAVPIPDIHEPQAASIQACVEQAVAESQANGIANSGKAATPWLLSRVKELTGGNSRASNIALLENTALVGTDPPHALSTKQS